MQEHIATTAVMLWILSGLFLAGAFISFLRNEWNAFATITWTGTVILNVLTYIYPFQDINIQHVMEPFQASGWSVVTVFAVLIANIFLGLAEIKRGE